jgi:glycyl-tRNA synthetase beta chain
VAAAYAGLEGKKLELSETETVAKVTEFATERLRGLLASATSNAVADAVLAGSGPAALENVVACLARARVLQAVVEKKEPWLEKAKIVAKRLAGISREAKPQLWPRAAFKDSKKPDDQAIAGIVEQLDTLTQKLASESAVQAALKAMGDVATELDRIFVETLVNDPDDAFTEKRLQTLAYGAQAMLRIADFSRLE